MAAPAMGGGQAPQAVPQQPAAKNMQYYKDLIEAGKTLKNSVKQLRVHKVDQALDDLTKVLSLLNKYSTQ